MSGSATRAYYLYNTLIAPLVPAILTYAIGRDLQRIGVAQLRDRFGFPEFDPDGAPLWVHAASMGETVAAAPIIHALQRRHPGQQVIISSITPTGHETARRLFPDCTCLYFPYDLPPFVERVLRQVEPAAIVLVESELWPNFIHLARARGIPVFQVNGRISDRTLRRALRTPLRQLYVWMLRGLTAMGMQSRADADRAVRLGADPACVKVIGNSKFDQARVEDPPAAAVAAEMGLPTGLPTLVAGSTHPGEDEAILDAFLLVRKQFPVARLIIAPRRLERTPGLEQAIVQRGLAAAFRSREADRSKAAEAPVFVLDTIGELRRVYALGLAAFVGGTLVPIGGHDLLQPLAKGKPVFFGPHTHNCKEIAAAVLERGAGRRVGGAEDLARGFIELINHPELMTGMSAAGLELLEGSAGASERYADLVERAFIQAPGHAG